MTEHQPIARCPFGRERQVASFSSEGYFGFPGFQMNSALTNSDLIFRHPGAHGCQGLKQGPEVQTPPRRRIVEFLIAYMGFEELCAMENGVVFPRIQ